MITMKCPKITTWIFVTKQKRLQEPLVNPTYGEFLKWRYPKIIHFCLGVSIINHPICGIWMYLGYISKVAAVKDCQNNEDQRSCGLAGPFRVPGVTRGYQGLQNPMMWVLTSVSSPLGLFWKLLAITWLLKLDAYYSTITTSPWFSVNTCTSRI